MLAASFTHFTTSRSRVRSRLPTASRSSFASSASAMFTSRTLRASVASLGGQGGELGGDLAFAFLVELVGQFADVVGVDLERADERAFPFQVPGPGLPGDFGAGEADVEFGVSGGLALLFGHERLERPCLPGWFHRTIVDRGRTVFVPRLDIPVIRGVSSGLVPANIAARNRSGLLGGSHGQPGHHPEAASALMRAKDIKAASAYRVEMRNVKARCSTWCG
jgi:hypothetical protein